ncbi:phage virion morphogenesis protein [Glaciecola sp. 1036]|uniref:phage virion morphogenesis protein n=1 Tax=Alteromonadaceae TaxID=72275 RepID=UPI003D0305AB
MAGTRVRVDVVGMDRVHKKLNKLLQKGRTLEPAFAEIGEYLKEATQERMNLQLDPSGKSHEPLAPETVRRKKGKGHILREEGYLMDTLHYSAFARGLLLGTDLEYAATHQFGREEDGIPARPFLGLTTSPWSDADEIVEILKGHLDG